MSGMMRRVVLSAAAAGMIAMVAGAVPHAQRLTPADLALRLSGTWVLNRELSTGFRTPGRRGGPSTSLGGGRFLVVSVPAQQRRPGGGGGRDSSPANPNDLTPEQRAEQAAMQQLQQMAERIVIKASPESVTFTDTRGERTFAIDDKISRIDVGASLVSVKSKWDKNVLKQEFSNTQAKLVETWGPDNAGRLVLTAKLESMTLMTPDEKAVFDRQ
jgi:hypothetical protein